ncbi:MAG: carboxypeptidase-like regulatory domain-containing protein [Desulfobulbaceae bacterium]
MRPLTSFILALCLLLSSPSSRAAADAVLTGTILDVSGNPVAGVEVFLYKVPNIRRPADFISPPTGSDGVYRVQVPAGRYWCVARLRHGEQRFGPLLPGDKHSGDPVDIEFGEGEIVEENFVVADLEETSRLADKRDSSFFRVEGILRNSRGEPLSDAYAFANRSEGMKKYPDYISAWTDASGRYTLFLPEGTYYFGLAREFPLRVTDISLTKVTIDSNVKNNNIVLDGQ